MCATVGEIIREKREALSLSKEDVADSLDVSQQTVDNWETGRSKPTLFSLQRLTGLLDIDETTLVNAYQYKQPSPASLSPPVRSLSQVLPLSELSEDKFEHLLAEIVTELHPNGHTSLYGSRGHKQDGIDILCASGSSNLAIGQCKRHKQFGPGQVKSAIEAVTIYAPKNYLFLSLEAASPAARQEAQKYEKWELWDGTDISRFIRALPRERALTIVDSYFPGHRDPFLGIAEPSPWSFPNEYFNAVPTAIFHHRWHLQGRDDELARLSEAAYMSGAGLAILQGAGGTGKTRLLKALCATAPQTTNVRILSSDAQVSSKNYELLPSDTDLLVLLDDAHDRMDLATVTSSIWQRNANANILIITRPYGRRPIEEKLAQHGQLPSQKTVVELGDLRFEDSRALAREALGYDVPERVARRLAALTMDSPLVTVVGGSLIKQEQLDPSALEQDQNIKDHIMRGFQESMVAASITDDRSTLRSVLEGVAALQPFRANEATGRESLSAIISKPYDELRPHLASLEDVGILRRRGESLRIIPDLLGDIILSSKAFDERSSIGTGYVERIEPLVTGNYIEHLFANINRVDWQLQNNIKTTPQLADSLWDGFFDRLKSAGPAERVNHVETLGKVAYFQPERALTATRWLINHPLRDRDRDNTRWPSIFDHHNSVTDSLSSVLKLVAMNADTLPEALQQLWELAQEDHRPTHQYPHHALRVLGDLVEFKSDKPLWFINQIIDVGSTWFMDDQDLSPFEVLKPALATEGHETRFQNNGVSLHSFSLNLENIQPIRQRVVDLGFDELRSTNLKRAGAATKLLKSALTFPSGPFQRTNEEIADWTSNLVNLIERLGSVVSSLSLDPAIIIAIRDILHWHITYGDTALSNAALKVKASLPRTKEVKFAFALYDGWGNLVGNFEDDYIIQDAKLQEVFNAAIEGVKSLSNDEVVDLLIVRYEADQDVHGEQMGHPFPFIAQLVHTREQLGQTLLERILEVPAPHSLELLLPVILGAYAEVNADAALETIEMLLNTQAHGRRRAASQALGWNRGQRGLHRKENNLLLGLASDSDLIVRENVVRSVQLLAPTHPEEAKYILAALRFGDNLGLASNYFACFNHNSGITWDSFSATELTQIRDDLIQLPSLNDFSTFKALSKRSATHPEWVVDLLQERASRAACQRSIEYQPLPYRPIEPLQVRTTERFLFILGEVFSWLTKNHDSTSLQKYGAMIFKLVAKDFDTEITEFLADKLSNGSISDTLAVSYVVGEAPRSFIWDQQDFVVSALHSAHRHGESALMSMLDALRHATFSGVRSSPVGEASPVTMEQRNKSVTVVESLPEGSIEKYFYQEILDYTEQLVRHESDATPFSDRREW